MLNLRHRYNYLNSIMIKNNNKLSAIAASGLIIVITLTAYFSLRAYFSSKKAEQNYKKTVQILNKDITNLSSRLDTLNNKMEALLGQTSSVSGRRPRPGEAERLPDEIKGKELKRIGEIIETTGLEQLAAIGKVDPGFLQEIYNDYTSQKQIDTYQQELRERNIEQQESDKDRYDEELFALYERARYRRREPPGDEEKDKAFEELLSKYPEAYATGMAIAQRAFMSAFQRDTLEVERYYDMLGNDKFTNLVTDRGIEALPNIEHMLVRNYLREGQKEKAEQFMDSLEKNYSNSIIFSRRPGKGPQLLPVQEVLKDLRQ